MEEIILFVDDEQNILNAVMRVFAEEEFVVRTATSADEALRIVRQADVAVLVSDNLMPGTRGIELLEAVKRSSPDTVKILMTGFADLPTAIEAINIGEVFRFVVKPWKNEELVQLVAEALNRYRVVKSLRRGDDAVIYSIAQAIELKDSYTRGHCDRVANYALMMAEALGLPDQAMREIRYGSWLHDCGKIGVPEAILNSPDLLTTQQYDTVKKHSMWGAEVARQAQLPDKVVKIILYHHERFDGGGYPARLSGTEIPLETRIVAVADVYDAITSDRPYRKAYPWQEALRILESLAGKHLDPELVRIFTDRVMTAHGAAAKPGGMVDA